MTFWRFTNRIIIIIIIINTRLYEELKTRDTESNSIILLTANPVPLPSRPLDDADIVNQAFHYTDTVLEAARVAIGVARGAVGAPATPRAVKIIFSRRNLQEKCVSAPPRTAGVNF